MWDLVKQVKFFYFKPTGSVEADIKTYMEKSEEIKMEFAVIVKIKQASRGKHSHQFFIVNNSKGLEDVFSFQGFVVETLVFQEYLIHQEQLYKVYSIDNKFDYSIRKSVPDSEVLEGNSYFFDNFHPNFPKDSFKKFD